MKEQVLEWLPMTTDAICWELAELILLLQRFFFLHDENLEVENPERGVFLYFVKENSYMISNEILYAMEVKLLHCL